MSKTTSLELSKKLYEALGWKGTEYYYCHEELTHKSQQLDTSDFHQHIPAYDTDFLLDKLPTWIEPTKKTPHLLTVQPNPIGSGWNALYRLAVKTPKIDYKHAIEIQESDTPAEALGNLALALKEKGLL